MNHAVFGKKLSRTANERKALIRNLMRSLILHGSIKTTKAKAQAARSEIEKLITKAKKNTDAAKRDVFAHIPDREVVKTFYSMVETRFAQRTSGYTRIIKIGVRSGDASEQVVLGFVDEEVKTEVIKPETKKSTSVKTAENKPTKTKEDKKPASVKTKTGKTTKTKK